MKKIMLILFVLCVNVVVYAQDYETTKAFNVKFGFVEYNNKLTIPNGVKGNIVGLYYCLSWKNCIYGNRSYLLIDFNTGGLKRNANMYRNRNQYVFDGGKIGVGKEWLFYNVSSCVGNKFYIGGFLSSEAEIVTIKKVNEDNGLIGANVFGRWTTGVDYTLRNQIKIEDIVIENFVCVPIVGVGYYADAPYKSKNIELPVSYYLCPNDLVLIGRLKQINYELKIGLPIGTADIHVLYRYKYHCYTKGIETQKYMLHQFGLGVKF